MFRSLIIAFSTYSRLPIPQLEWREENLKYAICFFPLIGGVIGSVALGWVYLCGVLELNAFFRAGGLTALPLLISGGIHMDGFCDTVDALSSHQSKERKLEILKDPHAGAFSIIFCGVWLLLYFAALTQPEDMTSFALVALGFVLSRSMSGLALANLKGARPSGMLQAFADAAHKRTVTVVMLLFILLSTVGMLLLSPLSGSAALLAAVACLLHYKRMAYRQFGGITGDLAGYFLQLCELGIALAVALTGRFV